MLNFSSVESFDFDSVDVDDYWNIGSEKENPIHKIHSYHAKFPAFITTKALEYAKKTGININTIGDFFCGCGTTAFEARRNNITFWGCDINPVATLIAKTKNDTYNITKIEYYFNAIVDSYNSNTIYDVYDNANPRLKYWYTRTQYNNLHHLYTTIIGLVTEHSKYRKFYLTAFSNILKSTSMWFSKAIKPQIDNNKVPADVILTFQRQIRSMIKAFMEGDCKTHSSTNIVNKNVLDLNNFENKIDMVVTSPPYATSYEYADLHQLSSLWLGYTKDYREMRSGTIGSNHVKEIDFSKLNSQGIEIINKLQKVDKSKAKSVAKYFIDMQKVSDITFNSLSEKGLAVFVIGNTEYKGVAINNVKHLAYSLESSGFRKFCISKRKIGGKFAVPFRDTNGKFTIDKNSRQIYNEEFILIGRK